MTHSLRFKRTKIVATIGPSSADAKTLERLVGAGLNVARLNFSHGTHADHAAYARAVRAAGRAHDEPVAVLQDLCGPKVRIGDFADGSVTLVPGKTLTLTAAKCAGSAERVFISYPHLAAEVKKGDRIMLDDGRRVLEVVSTKGRDVVTRVIVGGTIKGRRGVNIPGALHQVRALTAKDKTDLAFGLQEIKPDFVALSFVRSARDVAQLRALIMRQAPKHAPAIIAKIETVEAVEHLDEIIAAADGAMVARGDLAVEVGPENVPLIQKRVIRACVDAGKPVVTATQMLESMITAPVPTRAEVADVANAILDGTDAVMLSQETAMGEYPVEAVAMMARIAHQTENHSAYRDLFRRAHVAEHSPTIDAIGRAVVNAMHATDATVIVALSESGSTARMVARGRPTRPIIVLTPHEAVAQKLALSFACHPFVSHAFTDLLDVVADSKALVRLHKLGKKGDHVVIAAGVPFGRVGGTNMLMVETL
jgi:pyruvate kinase